MARPQTFVFYRPNPLDADRLMQLHFVAAADTALADFRQFLLLHWPDLSTAVHWQLIEIDDSLATSPFAVGDAKSILVWSSDDLLAPAGSVIAMVEVQAWDVHKAHLTGHLQPVSLWRDTTFTDLLRHLQIHDLCRTPCSIRQINQDHAWRRPLILWDAAFLRIFTVHNTANLRTLLEDPAGFNAINRRTIPTGFWQLAEVNAETNWPMHIPQVTVCAQQLQVALSLLSRSIYLLTGMRRLNELVITILTPVEREPQTRQFIHSVHRDPFGLYHDLAEHYHIQFEDSWKLVLVDLSYQPQQASSCDYVILLKQADYPPMGMVPVLILMDIQTAQQQAFLTRVRNVPYRFIGADLHHANLPAPFEEHCQLFVNGAFTPHNYMHILEPGAFIHVVRKTPDGVAQLQTTQSVIEDEGQVSHPPLKRVRQERAESSTNTMRSTSHAPPSPVGLDVALAWCLFVISSLLRKIPFSLRGLSLSFL